MNIIEIEQLSKKYYIKNKSSPTYFTIKEGFENFSKNFRHYFLKNNDELIEKKKNDYFYALKDVSASFKVGEKIGIIGKNGAGKSTLLKILSRITPPTNGQIKIYGRVAALLEVGTGFHPELTGRENIFLNGALLGMSKVDIKRNFDQIVDFSEVRTFLDVPVKRYSSGMYVRLAFSIAAHLEPDILILDEVLAVGDANFQKKCLKKVSESAESGRTIIFVSHNMGAISQLCNKCLLLEYGEILKYGNTKEVLNFYYGSNEKNSEVIINPKMRSRGGEVIQISSCILYDHSGEVKNHFLIGENLQVKFSVDVFSKNDISFWLIIYNSSGIPVSSAHQRDKNIFQVSEGRLECVFSTIDLWLAPGDYFITAGIFDVNMNFLEWIENCQSFEVYPCFQSGLAFDNRLGLTNQNGIWKIEKTNVISENIEKCS